MASSIPMEMDKRFRSLSFVLPVLFYGCYEWTLNSDWKRWVDTFGYECLCRITGHQGNNFVSKRKNWGCECKLSDLIWACGVVQIWPCSPGYILYRRSPGGHQQNSCFEQVEGSFELLRMGKSSAINLLEGTLKIAL